MIRTTVGGKGVSSFEATPLALWTPRSTGNNVTNSNNITSRSGPAIQLPFPAAGRLQQQQQQRRGPAAGRAAGDKQVEVLSRLPSLYTKLHSNGQQLALQQSQQQKQQPEPLPLLHGSKRMQQHRMLRQQNLQKFKQQQQQEHTDRDEAAGRAESTEPPEDTPGRSGFRISVADGPVAQEQKAKEPQKQPQQQQPRSVPMAYFSRGSASLHSTRCDDVDSRSCDLRHPDQTVAYSRAAVYIRDNELMSAAKARLIWRWMDELEEATPSAARLFAYDPASRWFSMVA